MVLSRCLEAAEEGLDLRLVEQARVDAGGLGVAVEFEADEPVQAAPPGQPEVEGGGR